jgi:uncharacterized protein (DUF488 family)
MGRVLTFGHGVLTAEALGSLLRAAGIGRLVDVRRFPGSRRHPHTNRGALAAWLPDLGIDYRWAEALGGRRSGNAQSPNTGLRNASFRAYADHMATPEFRAASGRLVTESAGTCTAVLCSESLWWRCHRRLIADHLVLIAGLEVGHLLHTGEVVPHEVTDTARAEGDRVVYAPLALQI